MARILVMLIAKAGYGRSLLVNGAKMITNGTIADVAVVWAKLDGVIKASLLKR